MRRLKIGSGMVALLSCACVDVLAQDVDAGAAERDPLAAHPRGTEEVFPPSFYAPYQPQTALDMLARTPGFTIDGGAARRGFGNGAGNVLIDGKRPTVKAGGLSTVLGRIPARQVERIALLRGGNAAEAQGQGIVADVILRADAGGAGNGSVAVSRGPTGRLSPSANLSYAKQIGAWKASIDIGAELGSYESTTRYLLRDAADRLTTARLARGENREREGSVAGSAARGFAGGTLTLNGRLDVARYSSGEVSAEHPGGFDAPVAAIRDFASAGDSLAVELGADWAWPLGEDWEGKLVALGRWSRSNNDQRFESPGFASTSGQRSTPIEAIGRVTLARGGVHRLRPEVGMEVAYNRLSSRLGYVEDRGSGPVPIVLPGADTTVDEMRGEVFANATLTLGANLTAEAGIVAELSRIGVTGDAANSQSLSYLKPSAALNWQVSRHTGLRASVRRTVDQLDFNAFAASVQLYDDRQFGGNAELRPERYLRADLRLNHRWGSTGTLVIEGYHVWTSGRLGYILLDGKEALGDIGNSRLWGVTAWGTLPLTDLLAGAQLTLGGMLQDSFVHDPITGRSEQLSGIVTRSFSATFRHDLSEIRSSWGFGYSMPQRSFYYYATEDSVSRSDAQWSAWIETTAFAGVKAMVSASGIGGTESRQLRSFYAPRRGGRLTGSEERLSREGTTFSLSLSRAL